MIGAYELASGSGLGSAALLRPCAAVPAQLVAAGAGAGLAGPQSAAVAVEVAVDELGHELGPAVVVELGVWLAGAAIAVEAGAGAALAGAALTRPCAVGPARLVAAGGPRAEGLRGRDASTSRRGGRRRTGVNSRAAR